RLKIPPGDPIFLLDQLDFIIGAIFFAIPFYELSLEVILLIILITLPIHILANLFAYFLKLKQTLW
ncbi:MAG: CDP-archaeol synthase, partial [Candidatus Bathyarchaeia archaeon]